MGELGQPVAMGMGTDKILVSVGDAVTDAVTDVAVGLDTEDDTAAAAIVCVL